MLLLAPARYQSGMFLTLHSHTALDATWKVQIRFSPQHSVPLEPTSLERAIEATNVFHFSGKNRNSKLKGGCYCSPSAMFFCSLGVIVTNTSGSSTCPDDAMGNWNNPLRHSCGSVLFIQSFMAIPQSLAHIVLKGEQCWRREGAVLWFFHWEGRPKGFHCLNRSWQLE